MAAHLWIQGHSLQRSFYLLNLPSSHGLLGAIPPLLSPRGSPSSPGLCLRPCQPKNSKSSWPPDKLRGGRVTQGRRASTAQFWVRPAERERQHSADGVLVPCCPRAAGPLASPPRGVEHAPEERSQRGGSGQRKSLWMQPCLELTVSGVCHRRSSFGSQLAGFSITRSG